MFVTAVTIFIDFGAQENEIWHYFHFSPSICHEVIGLDARILVFWMLSFKPTFSLSFFTFIKRLFSSPSFSAIRVVSSAYLRLLIFLPAILIPAYESSSPAFHMMYSAYKLNKQGGNIKPWRAPFPILNQSVVPCPVLTVASCPAYRFLRRQVSGLVFPSLCLLYYKACVGWGFPVMFIKITDWIDFSTYYRSDLIKKKRFCSTTLIQIKSWNQNIPKVMTWRQ